jgi:hypothetical protein
VICASDLLFIPHQPALWAIPVLQELRELVAATTELIAEINLRFKAGDPASELIRRLESSLAVLAQRTSGVTELPDDLRTEIARLLSRVQDAVTTGDAWLDQTGPELAAQQLRQRLRRTYGRT